MKDSKLFEYKGYLGSIEPSTEDRCFCGSVQFVRDLISYSGNSYDELEQNFHSAVDEYLAFCKEIGQDPSVTCSGTFNIRIGSELHHQAVVAAKKTGKNLNEFVKEAVQGKVEGKLNVEHHLYLHGSPVKNHVNVLFSSSTENSDIWRVGSSQTFYRPTSTTSLTPTRRMR